MSAEVTYRWVDGRTATKQEWDGVDKILESRGWMSLNRETTRILIAEDEKELAGFNCLQLIPHLGPMYVARKYRGTPVANMLADKMSNFMYDNEARGFLVIAEHPIVAKMCEERGLIRVSFPVFVSQAGG